MCGIRTNTLELVVLCILAYCHHIEAIQLLPFNVVDSFEELGNYLGAENNIPKLTNDILDIVKNGGLEKFKAGSNNEDKDLNVTQLIEKYHYPAEEHHVHTTDGYILALHRIPSNGPVAFLMHGFISSSDDWVTAGPKKALPYLLAEQGYDVWMGNARGSKYSRRHEQLSPASAQFWDFSWDEIGRYDLPSMIDYVLQVTGKKQLKYVGHSQGTTIFFVLCSEKPEYNDKVSLMVALSPIAWISHITSPPIRLIAPLTPFVDILLAAIGLYEFLPSDVLIKTFTRGLCGNTEFATLICSNVVFLFMGFDYAQLDVENMPVILSHIPGGSSKKQLVHYLQEINSGKFRKYDYGSIKNLKVYRSLTPPEYPIQKVTTQVALFYSQGDWVSNVTDVEILAGKLPKLVDYYEIPLTTFCHTDYLWAKDVKNLVYSRILELFNKF